MSRLKEILNDPRTVVGEALDGMAPVSGGRLSQAERIERDPARRHSSFKGATTMTQPLIVTRRVRHILADSIIIVFRSDMSRLLTCQEMAGFSISLLRPGREWKHHLDLSIRLLVNRVVKESEDGVVYAGGLPGFGRQEPSTIPG
jgi:hypothetical protein